MATLKHINSKNADYGAAEQYLLFEHDEFTMKPVLDETGRLIPREDYRLSTLNCDGEDFAVACMRANLRYQKNQRREDVKSHHYIISFDPRDGPDNGLTVDRAQALGEQFCKEHFPGHQALVCTHPDGHNHSGNIHVHIVINSLRIEEVPFLPYMDRPADTKVGCKHRCTDAALRYFKSEVMEMCHREGLYQIDLLNGSKNRVTDREYWAQKKGQAALDKQNAPMIADSITPRQTKFETNKEKLRQTKWLLDSLERRGSTLRRCAQAILDAQRSFFSGQTVELSPMKLSSLAETLDLHPSTVSRAVRDKYLQCRQGIYPLRYFFSRAVGQQGLSRQAVKQRMLLRFKDEDSSHPLSDQTLCDLLAEEGIFLARRTVAKYRIELGIGSSTARRARNRGK